MKSKLPLILVFVLFVAGFGFAQDYWRRGQRRNQRLNTEYERNGVPNWELKKDFEKDVFTFARIEYDYRSRWGWDTDYPDADLNLSYRLQEMTSLKVDPQGVHFRLTDSRLFQYPFVYLIEPGGMYLHEPEVLALRQYLNKGGFMLVDDFWEEYEWENFYREIKRVFPDREPVDLPLSHEIFHIVYELKELPIVPDIHSFYRGQLNGRRGVRKANYRAILDDDDRIMVMICHNTDLGDGWEREGVDPRYFEAFSEKFAYPLGINIITYAMTH